VRQGPIRPLAAAQSSLWSHPLTPLLPPPPQTPTPTFFTSYMPINGLEDLRPSFIQRPRQSCCRYLYRRRLRSCGPYQWLRRLLRPLPWRAWLVDSDGAICCCCLDTQDHGQTQHNQDGTLLMTRAKLSCTAHIRLRVLVPMLSITSLICASRDRIPFLSSSLFRALSLSLLLSHLPVGAVDAAGLPAMP
jgi:hypothetical protein